MSQSEAEIFNSLREVLGIDPDADESTHATVSVGDLKRLCRSLAQSPVVRREGMHAAFFRQLIDSLPDFIYFKDRQSRILFSNPAHIENLGCATLAEVLGKTDFDFFKEPFAREKFADEQRIIATGKGWSGKEEHHLHQDGSESWALSTKLPLYDEHGEICGTFGISRDITEKKFTELELERQRLLMDTIIQILPCSLFVRNREGRFMLVNQDYLTKSGLPSSDALLGKTLEEAFPGEDTRAPRAEDERVMTENIHILNRVSYDQSLIQQKRWMSTSKVPLRNAQNEVGGLVGITWDITEQKEAEERAREAYRALAARTRQMENELDVARTLQERLIAEGLDDACCFHGEGPLWALRGSFWYQPSHHLAGDFVHIARIDQARIGVLICDVMGHGVKASLVTMLIRGMFQDASAFSDRPDVVLSLLNRRLAAFAEDPLFPRFVTALYLVLDLDRGLISYANAGHHHPLFIDGSPAEPGHAPAPGTALGLLPDEQYARIDFPIRSRQTIALFSDGLIEAENASGAEFGIQRLREALAARYQDVPSAEILAVRERFHAFLGPRPCSDDICLVVINVEPRD